MPIERLVAGTNVTVVQNGKSATISAAVPGGSGEANTASDATANGVGLFHQKAGVDLQFKKLYAPVGGNVAIAASAEEPRVEITVPNASTATRGAAQLAADGGTTAGTVVQATDARLSNARTPTAHSHPQSDVTGLVDALAAKQATSEKGQANGYASLGADGKVPAAQLPATSGGGAKATYIPLVRHFTTLEETTSANAAWKIPAATTYGQSAVRLDMTQLGTPIAAELVVVYTNTAASGTNQIGIRLGAAPVAAGTTVVPVASSVATLANSSAYPQTIVKAITVAELGSTAQWVQLALNLASSAVGPNIFSADLVLYY
jgi:hypothetical protein